MNKVVITKESKIKVLKYARKRIESFKNDFICQALENSTKNRRAVNYLKLYIIKQLDGNLTLSGWLEDNIEGEAYTDNMRKIRLQWIDWMIANAT